MSKLLKVLLADKQALTRIGLISILAFFTEVQFIEDTADIDQIKQLILSFAPLVFILEHQFSAQFFTRNSKKTDLKYNPKRILMLFNKVDAREVLALQDRGIQCYISKESSKEEIIKAVYAAANEEPYYCAETQKLLEEQKIAINSHETLTLLSSRESEIIQLIAEGLTNHQIADKLFLSFHTIKTHRKNMIKKLGFTFKNTAELAAYIKI